MTLPKAHNYDPKRIFDLMIIGSGMAGMAASLFAVNRNLSAVQAGSAGGTLFTSGLMDILSVYPPAERRVWDNPWAALAELRKNASQHPYARVSDDLIRRAFDAVTTFCGAAGIKFRLGGERNLKVITSMGTMKYTYGVPESMWACVEALADKRPCLVIGFQGLKEFSARQVTSTIADEWPSLRACRVVFPGTEGRTEVYAVHLAQALELASIRESLAERIRPHIADARAVGFPAVLGIKRTSVITAHLEKLLGVPVFEIPMMPASVPGFRLKELFDSELPKRGLLRLIDKRVDSVSRLEDGTFVLSISGEDEVRTIRARGVILATGRFMGKGILSDRRGIFEPLFNIPLHQPNERALWHSERFLDPRGHPLNSAGVEVDEFFRPVDNKKNLIHENLFAAGTILAHQDWMRMKCGTGIAIATAYAAVEAFSEMFIRAESKVVAQ